MRMNRRNEEDAPVDSNSLMWVYGVDAVMAATIAGLFGLLAMASGGPAFFSGRRSIDVIFKDGQGIRSGSSVRVAGIDAGRVEAVDLADREGVLWARVRLSVSSDLVRRLKQDAKITIQSGLTGQSWVNIVSSGRSSVALVPGQLVQGVESTMFDPIIEQVGLGAVERGHLSHTIGEVRQTVDAIGPRVRQILASLQESATNLKETSSSIRPSVEAAAGKVEELARRLDAAKIEDTVNRLNSAVTHADGLLGGTLAPQPRSHDRQRPAADGSTARFFDQERPESHDAARRPKRDAGEGRPGLDQHGHPHASRRRWSSREFWVNWRTTARNGPVNIN